MPGYTLPLTESRIIADLLKRQRGLSVGLVGGGVGGYRWEKDHWTVAATPATTYTLTYVPIQNSALVTVNGQALLENTDYTVDYTTGVVTVSFPLTGTPTPADLLEVDYVTTGDLAAQTGQVVIVDWAATGWKYLAVAITDTTDYSSATFNDSAWTTAQAAFGNGAGPSPVNTSWNTPGSASTASIWVRRSVAAVSQMQLTLRIDNRAYVWVNGTQVVNGSYGADNGTLEVGPVGVSPDLLNQNGPNVVAMRVDDTGPYATGNVSYADLKIEGTLA